MTEMVRVERKRGRAAVRLRVRRLRAEPLCRMCEAEGRITAATVPDHIVPLARGGTDADSNVQCLCEACHDKKTRADMGWQERRTIGADGWPT